MFGKAFWINLFERAISTFAQSAVGVLSASALGLLHVNWLDVVSVAGLAAVLSVLKSFQWSLRRLLWILLLPLSILRSLLPDPDEYEVPVDPMDLLQCESCQ